MFSDNRGCNQTPASSVWWHRFFFWNRGLKIRQNGHGGVSDIKLSPPLLIRGTVALWKSVFILVSAGGAGRGGKLTPSGETLRNGVCMQPLIEYLIHLLSDPFGRALMDLT
jgi:hypothetical protein